VGPDCSTTAKFWHFGGNEGIWAVSEATQHVAAQGRRGVPVLLRALEKARRWDDAYIIAAGLARCADGTLPSRSDEGGGRDLGSPTAPKDPQILEAALSALVRMLGDAEPGRSEAAALILGMYGKVAREDRRVVPVLCRSMIWPGSRSFLWRLSALSSICRPVDSGGN
jgi:hypothetical protein